MRRWMSTAAVLMASVTVFAEGDATDRAIRAVKELCLVGTQYDLRVDASGNLTLSNLAAGAARSVTVNARESSGAAAIFDDKIRQVADEDIRQCIKPHITPIIDAILGEVSKKQLSPRDELLAFAKSKDEETRERVQVLRWAQTSNQQCISLQLRINSASSPSGSLEGQVRRYPESLSPEQAAVFRNQLSQNANNMGRMLAGLIIEGQSQGCIGM